MIGFVDSKTVIFILTTVRVRGSQKLLKTFNCGHCSNETITGEKYRIQLMRMSRALREKRPQHKWMHENLILQHNIARSQGVKSVKNFLEALKWEIFPHPPYSSDIVPSFCNSSRSIAHGLADQKVCSYESVKKFDSWTASKDELFYYHDI